MKVIKAKTSGFCMGVKRAMQIAVDTSNSNSGRVCTLGPLIHNPQAIEYLKENGVETLPAEAEVKNGTVIVRAHGIPYQEYIKLKNNGLNIVDATCPHVIKSQKQIKKYSEENWHIAIVGDPNHPEIKSLQSYAREFTIIRDLDSAKKFQTDSKVMIIAQTTYNGKDFDVISHYLSQKLQKVAVCKSICQATSERQKEIRELANVADAVIIVGGKESANTKRLAQIAKEYCKNVQHIETVNSLNTNLFKNCENVVVSAGASTPDFITEKVIEKLSQL